MFDSYIERISTIAGVNSEDKEDEILSDEGDSDGDRISSLLGKEAKEITSRPMEFGSEFGKTGGIAMPKDMMNDFLSVDKPHVAALAGTLCRTAQRLESPEIDIAEIASLANVGVRGLARYTIVRIITEGRIICDAIYATDIAMKENRTLLTELYHQLAEQEKKAKWFREQQDKIQLSNTEVEKKKREIDDSIRKISNDDGKVFSLGERVGFQLSEADWMDRIVPAGLRHGTSVGWSRKHSIARGRGVEATPKDTDTLSPRPLQEIMGEGSTTAEEPVTDPTEHLPDGVDNTLSASQLTEM